MQVIDYHEAIFASKLSAYAKLTALVISSYYNWTKKQMCWPSNKTLSQATGLSISSLVRAKKELAREGYLEVQRRIDNSNLYRPIVPQNRGYVPLDQHPWSDRATNNEVNNEVNNGQGADAPLVTNNINHQEIWRIFENEERFTRPQPAGRGNRKPGKSNRNPRRNNQDIPGVAESSEGFDQEATYRMGGEW
jgi:hypothetical protein